MKKIFIAAAAAAFALTTAFAQSTPRTEARTEEGRRILTMEEAVLGYGQLVQNPVCRWTDGGHSYVIDTTPSRVPHKGILPAVLHENNLYLREADGTETAITAYSDRNIVCGQSVSRNEFGISGGVFFSPDSTKIAFYKKDESRVTTFPLLDINTRTGSLVEIKYPMNGMASEVVSLGVYDIASKSTVWMDVTDFDQERYLTNITWSPSSDIIYIQVLDRAQKNMHLNAYRASDGSFIKTLLTEHNDKFVEPENPLVFLDADPDLFLYNTDNRNGYKNLYLCSASGKFEPKRLTDVDADVQYLDQRGKDIYYYSYEVSPVEQHLFKVDIKKGRKVRLTTDRGWHDCSISPDGKYFIDKYSSLNVPRVIKYSSTDGKRSEEIFRAESTAKEYNYCPIELGTVKSADGRFDNWYRLIKPLDFDPAKKYPVILYVYGGPHSQLVADTYQARLRRWEMYMAQRGYVVFVMDNRGTPNHGAEYEKAIHRQCGKVEMEDQMEGMKWLMSHPWVDRDRIGVHGWSYGGFMTISLMVNYPEVFKVGVAGGPVIDWKWYEVMYGERYMETAETNPEGFASTSLIPRAKDLKGKLLICQGAIDNTVVWEHSLSFIESCIKNGVQVDYFPYPTHEHNVSGKDRVHLMQKVTDYFEDYLR